jgi:hypothetical protein
MMKAHTNAQRRRGRSRRRRKMRTRRRRRRRSRRNINVRRVIVLNNLPARPPTGTNCPDPSDSCQRPRSWTRKLPPQRRA